jgi:signal transduction histidine kinase
MKRACAARVGTPKLQRFFPSLRARFAVLLVALGVLAVGPSSIWAMCDLGSRALGRERVEELARQVSRLADDADEPAVSGWHPRRVTLAAREHRTLLTSLLEPGNCKEVGAEACEALGSHLRRWDTELEPMLLANALPSPALGARLRAEARELDRIADLASRGLRSRANQVRQLATAVSTLSIVLVGLVAFGVWEVFSRVRRIRASTLSPNAERELVVHGNRADELGGLARALAGALEESRTARERDAERLTLLATHQQALEQFAQTVNEWLAGADTLEAGLTEIAELCGYDAIRLERSPTGADQPAAGRHRISWRGRFLGTLELEGRGSDTFPDERARLVETLVQLVSLACMARHLLAEREQYSALTRSLSSLASLEVGATDLDARIGALIDFDVASLLLMDETERGEQCLILERGRLSRAPAECSAEPLEQAEIHAAEEACTCPELASRGAKHILAIPLRVAARPIGVLQLARRSAPFSDADLGVVATLEALIGPALARIRLQDRLRWLYQSNALHGFARLLSHELKNPLNSSNLQLETLARRVDRIASSPPDQELVQASIEAMRSELERLGRVVDEQLDLLRCGGHNAVPVAEVDLNQLAREVIDEQIEQIEQQGLTLELALSQNPAQIVGSRSKLRLLIRHLLSNAVESMQSSNVRNLMITTRDGGAFWDLVVRDTGCGIPDPLEIFSAGYTTKPSGTGMGLAVSLHIAREHGGRLTARRAGGGSELVLSLAKTAPICSSSS